MLCASIPPSVAFMQCSLSVHAGSTMMIVMEYMGNGVLDSFLRVSAVCWLLGSITCSGFSRHRSAPAFPPPLFFLSFFLVLFAETRGPAHGQPAPQHVAGDRCWHEIPSRDGLHTQKPGCPQSPGEQQPGLQNHRIQTAAGR